MKIRTAQLHGLREALTRLQMEGAQGIELAQRTVAGDLTLSASLPELVIRITPEGETKDG